MKAMILAAGFGTRLRPYSLIRPKPLFPLLTTPLLLHTIQRLKGAGFTEIGINCHHLAMQIRESVKDIEGIHLFPEEDILGTGGGLQNAAAWFGDEPVLVTNGDIFHDFDFAEILSYHVEQGRIATLVCHDFPRFNKVSLGEDNMVMQFSPCKHAARVAAFTGVHVLEPRALAVVPPGFSTIIDCYNHWLQAGEVVQAMMVHDQFWTDMGTVDDYLDLHSHLLRQAEEPLLVHPSVATEGVSLKDWVSIGENALLGQGCSLERVVVWDGAVVEPGSCLKDTIVT